MFFMRTLTIFLFSVIVFISIPSTFSASVEKHDGNITNDAVSCFACKASVVFIRSVYEQNRSRDFLIKVASFICQHFVHEESFVCYALATQFREEILYVINETILQPDKLCSIFIRNCEDPESDTSSWNITLPPERPGQQYPTYPVIQKKNLRVLHITDLHLDPKYAPGSEANCTNDLCCHEKPGSNGSSAVTQESGYWGSIAVCDIPYRTVDNMFQNIQKLEKIDYIMVGGDYESHMDWTYTKEGHLETIRNLSTMLHHYFPDIPIYWTLGNHEGVPIDSFAPHYIPEKYRPQWLYDELLQLQKPFINKKSLETIRYRGSYMVQIHPGMRLISLNSGYCEPYNFWMYINETDPDGTLSWLVSELESAELAGQYVHILSHIPPGDRECLESWARNYYKIVVRFSKTIKAQYFGHIHVDSFTVFYENINDDSSKPINVLYASPSVTTYMYLNPAFRIYEIEPGINYRVVNFHTYFLNLSQVGMNTAAPTWDLLYSAKEEYDFNDLSPTSWDDLINRIIYEKKTYDKFIRNSNRQDNFVCDGKCRFESLCFLRKGHHSTSLCDHIPSRDIARNRYSFVRNPYRSSRIGDLQKPKKLGPTIASARRYFPTKKNDLLLRKRLRAYVVKKFVQLFLLPDPNKQ